MLFVIGVGNTVTELGFLEGRRIIARDRIATEREKTSLEYSVLFRAFMEMNGISADRVDGAILSSVVPDLSDVILDAARRATGTLPLLVGPGVKSGLKIRIDDPKQLGAELVARTVGGIERYGCPLILVNMGSATTFSAINDKAEFIGTVIVPGIGISLNALVQGTSQLPGIELNAPLRVIGTNTRDSMKSGAIFGQAALIDGLVGRIRDELGGNPVITASGSYAMTVIPCCRERIVIDDELLFAGLGMIYEKNKRKK